MKEISEFRGFLLEFTALATEGADAEEAVYSVNHAMASAVSTVAVIHSSGHQLETENKYTKAFIEAAMELYNGEEFKEKREAYMKAEKLVNNLGKK